MATHVLFESASGYAIFEIKQHEEIGAKTKAVQDSIDDVAKFGKIVNLVSFSPFKSAAHALENANDISEGVLNDHLKSLLEMVLSKAAKKSSVRLGVSEAGLGSSIKSTLSIECDASERSQELIRGIRLHAPKLLKGMQADDLTKAQLGLGHSYSRAKVKFNVNRMDNMIIQAIALLDQLDKDVNQLSMRVREWYGFHFPELVRLVPDNYQYARSVLLIGAKETLDESKLPDLTTLLEDDSTRAQNILDAARGSMGPTLSEVDMITISALANRVVSLADYRKNLTSYLSEKMSLVAPSLTALLGERIGARLISHAGSLTNLSKYPASTVQILGAEKALFRALKTKGNTPKYGLLYHSSFISRAGPKHKGRISRFLANKTSIASRIDCFSEYPSAKFGDALRGQVEERLTFFEKGDPPSKNAEVMRKVLASIQINDDDSDADADMDAHDVENAPLPLLEASPQKEKKQKKDKGKDKDKKEKKKEKKDKKEKKEKELKENKDEGAKDKKKRKADEMDVDEPQVEVDDKASKKVKLSKEEKKALKKAKEAKNEKNEAKVKEEKSKKEKKKKRKSEPVDSDSD